jgi:PAS domain S-box-containing protein
MRMLKTIAFGSAIGLALALMGMLVLIGWVFQIAPLVQVREHLTAMVANTAICFVLLGLALAMTDSARARLSQTVLGATVVFISLAVLLENISAMSIGVDWKPLHAWIKDGNHNPGRMASNTALAFLCAGVVALLLPRVDSKFKGIVAQVCTFIVLLLGLTGLVGHALQLSLLFSWLSSTQMALHTAIGLILLGLGLWGAWRNEQWYSSNRYFGDDEKIGFVSVASLVVVAITSGIAGFAGQKAGLEHALSDRLPSEFRNKATIFNAAIDRSFSEARSIAGRPNLLRLTAELASDPNNSAMRSDLDRIGQSAIASGISGFRIVGLNTQELVSAGTFANGDKIAFTLNAPFRALLIWDAQFFARVAIPLMGPSGEIGTLHVEQPLPLITRLMMDKDGLGRTGSLAMCFTIQSSPQQLKCFPHYRNPNVYEALKVSANGSSTPMALAVEGKLGMFQGLDFKGKSVIAVHGPFTDNGLGFIIKQDAEELLAPIRDQILWTGPLLLILVISGGLLLRFQIAPLTSRLIASERAASERELKIQTLVQSVGEGIITFSSDGVVETFNGEAASIFGYEPSEIVGKKIDMLMPEAFPRTQAVGTNSCLAGGAPSVAGKGRVQLQGLHQSGRIFPLELTVNAIVTREGTLFVGVVRDTTEQTRARRELENAMEAAQKAASARSIFVANMSHELRTPMNAVLGISELLSRSALTANQRRDLGMIRSAGQSLLAIINNILDFSKIEAGKVELSRERFNLDEVLRNLAAIMSMNAADSNIELAIGVDLDVPRELIGDAQRLEQVLVNLSANAIKFTEQGEVSVRVALEHRIGDQAQLHFSVNDTGVGISEEQQSRLFSPFSQADSSTTRRYGGTGLGLTISKGLVELLGGAIMMKSAIGEGSTFSFSIPVQVAKGPSVSVRKFKPLKILLIDDNATSRSCLSDTIRSWQWDVEAVSSGPEALQRLEACKTDGLQYDVVLADWQMPGMDGIATMTAIRTLFDGAAMPIVILVTAYGRGCLPNDMGSVAPEAMLIKPVTASSLFDTMQEVLAVRGNVLSSSDTIEAADIRIAARVLLVEDNLINQFVARSFLEHAGATVHIAENGQEAIDCLRGAREFDVILMDIQMPVMDGFEATKVIRSELKLATPIIAMTAGVMQEEQEQCLAAGMDAFVGKPIDVTQMLMKIRALIQPDLNP